MLFQGHLVFHLSSVLFKKDNSLGRFSAKFSMYDGATVVRHYKDNWGAFTLGSYINGDNSIRANPNNESFQHEYGHYLQSQEAGWAYLPKYAIPSLINASRTPDNYDGYLQHMAFGV